MTGLIKSLGPDWSQAPTDLQDFTFDWKGAGWLAPGDTITASGFTFAATRGTPSAPTINSPASSFTPESTTCWFTGGDDGSDYVLYNQITTAAGRKRTRSILIRVRSQQ